MSLESKRAMSKIAQTIIPPTEAPTNMDGTSKIIGGLRYFDKKIRHHDEFCLAAFAIHIFALNPWALAT
jgi:hypothetical protein